MTTSLRMPPDWANNDLYSSGVDTGTATKIDPASDANGFIRGTAISAQAVNFLVNRLSTASRRSLAIQLCKPRVIPGLTLSATGTVAAVSIGRGKPAILGNANAGGVPRVADGDYNLGGVIASITAGVFGGAFNPAAGAAGRIVLVGANGNRSTYSDDEGGTWSAGGNLGGTGTDCIWNTTYSRFQAGRSGNLNFSTDATAWTGVAVAGYIGRGIAMLPNGNTYVLTGDAPVTGSFSTNGGTSWSAMGGLPPSIADYGDRGSICGAGIDYIYHVATRVSNGNLQVSRSSDGSTWVETAEVSKVNGLTFANAPIIRQCPDTGALFMSGYNGYTTCIYASLDQGVNWTEPLFCSLSFSAIQAAHGRVFICDSAGALYASDGIGWL